MTDTLHRLKTRFSTGSYDENSPKAWAIRVVAATLDILADNPGPYELAAEKAFDDICGHELEFSKALRYDIAFRNIIFATVSGMLECLTTEVAA